MKYLTSKSSAGLNAFFTAIIIVMVINSTFLWNAFQAVRSREVWVSHSNAVVMEIESISSYTKDAETGMRGYLLTGKSEYLEPYYSGVNQAWASFRRLKLLTADNANQQSALSAIETTLTKRFSILANVIEEVSKVGVMSRKGTLNEGKIVMDQLRAYLVDMRQEEEKLLAQRRQNSEDAHSYAFISIVGSALINIIMAFAAFYIIRRRQMHITMESEAKERELALKSRVSEISKIVANDYDTPTLSKKVLSYLVDELRVPAASFYVRQGDELVGSAHYARVGENLHIESLDRVQIGTGLLGEAVQKAELLEVKNIPANYFWVSSSLGKTQPTSLALVPLVFFGKSIAIIELGLFKELDQDQKEFLQQSRELIATGVSASENRGRLEGLLDTTQLQAQELQTQQEELRSTNEDLEEQARMLEKQQEVVNARNTDLEKINQYKSDFLAKMSHELRTPLNSLLILSTLLRENKEGNLSDQQKNFASTIYDSGNDLLVLINDILDLSKIEARKLTIRSEKFSVQSLLEQLSSTFMPQTQKKGLALVSTVADDCKGLFLETDLQRLSQILRNFLSNAVKFTEKGTIQITAHNFKNGFVDLSVKDSGIGIPADQRNLIFDAFEQGDGSISRKYGGTGLGLAISKELAQLLGGSIIVQSQVGTGSEFTLRIPLVLPASVNRNDGNVDANNPIINRFESQVKASPSAEVQAIVDSAHGKKKTLLIVEDDETFSKLVAEAGQAHGFHSIEVNSGELALHVLERFTPTAIMLDIKLPGISGFGILETLKELPQLRHVPVHMISAMDYPQHTLRMGAMGYLGKPVTMDQIHEAVKQLEVIASESTRRLLIVEDNKVQREAIEQLLAGPDIELTSVANGEEALKAVLAQEFHCIVLDLALPDISGKDFLEKLKAMEHQLPPVIVYTAQQLTKREEEYLRKFSESIILKGARSPERLLDEVSLFLHRVSDTLPLAQQKMINGLRIQDDSFEGRKVLLVDDDVRNIFALTHVLENKGFKVEVARDGVEALEAAEKHNDFDVILMDLMMPRMDGFEAIKRIRALSGHEKTPIIALTAKAMKGDHEKALEVGANDYLPKPINITSLFSVLKVWLREREIFQ
jgi:CheY-like chemotaxis protein